MPGKKHRLAIERHAIRRARERYGLEINVNDLNNIIREIQQCRSVPVDKKTNSRVVHELEYNGTMIQVLYSSSFKMVMTFCEWGDFDGRLFVKGGA